MAVKSVNDLLMYELQDIYHAEKQLVKALPKMAKKAKSDQLRQAVEHHLEETKGHVQRLEQVFEKLDAKPRAKRCEAMEGLIEEAEELMGEIATSEVLDAAMIGAAQKVEHYEIASYGTLSTLAQELDTPRSPACSSRRSTRRRRPIRSSMSCAPALKGNR